MVSIEPATGGGRGLGDRFAGAMASLATTTTSSSSSSVHQNHKVAPSVLTEALVREYLHREGLKVALAAFDRERPRDAASITNKSVLRKALGLDRAASRMRKKLEEGEKLPSALEILVRTTVSAKRVQKETGAGEATSSRVAGPAGDETAAGGSSRARWTAAQTPPEGGIAPRVTQPDVASKGFANERPSPPKPREAGGRSFLLGELRTIGAEAAAARTQRAPAPRVPRPQRPSTAPPKRPATMVAPVGPPPASTAGTDDLVLEDVDFDQEFSSSSGAFTAPAPRTSSPGAPHGGGPPLPPAIDVDISAARALKASLLGPNRHSPPPSWVQGFYFSDNPKLAFGLVQRDGGPCGVLAAVQAATLDALMEDDPDVRRWAEDPSRAITGVARTNALVRGLGKILGRAAGSGGVVSVVSGSDDSSFRGFMGSLRQRRCSGAAETQAALRASLPHLQDRCGYGLLSFVLSVVLTRGAERVALDMDDPTCGLIGGYGYCTQDLVNLLMTGRAATNLFDGNMQLDEQTTLKGIGARSSCGYLTVYEWYRHLKVGSNLKDPYKPIWVVNSESHYSVLFSADPNSCQPRAKGDRALPLDLYYYDELANQDDLIRLTVAADPERAGFAGEEEEDRESMEDRPPLEKVIETRWPGVRVDWNGADPIL